ncbi:hypothetical protein HDU67_001051 [Dinochytrium kinnereticum]|nr:hypothetical protein HDU67_001051 [Dinochytrium kinnereticum]
MEDKKPLDGNASQLLQETRGLIDRMLERLCFRDVITRESILSACEKFDRELCCPFGHRVPDKAFEKHMRKCLRKRLGPGVFKRPMSTLNAYKNTPGIITLLKPNCKVIFAATNSTLPAIRSPRTPKGDESTWEVITTPFGKVRRKMGLSPEDNGLSGQMLDSDGTDNSAEGRLAEFDRERSLFKYLRSTYGVPQKSEVDRLDDVPNIIRRIKQQEKENQRREDEQMRGGGGSRKHRASMAVKLRRKTHTAVARELIAAMMGDAGPCKQQE